MTPSGSNGGAEDLFFRALEVSAEDRATFLDEACQGDAELRREIESLLKHHRPETILDVPSRRSARTSDWGSSAANLMAAISSTLLGGHWRQATAWVLAAVSLGFFGYFMRENVQKSLENQLRSELRIVLDADVTAMETWIEAWKREANAWAENPEVRTAAERLVTSAGGDPEKARKLEGSPELEKFNALFRPFLASVPAGDAAVMLTVREGFRLGLGRSGRRDSQQAAAFMVPVFEGQTKFAAPSRADSWSLDVPADPRVIVFVAAPVRGSDRRVLGSLVFAKLWSLGFSQILTVARAGASGETYAVSPDGVMLSESRFDNALKKTGLLPDESNAESVFRVQVRDPGGDLTNGYKPGLEVRARPLTRIASAAIASRDKTPEQQSGIILEPYRDYRGIDVIGAWRWLPEYDFAIVTEVDASEAFTPVGHITRAFKVLLGLVGLFAGLMLLASICLARAQQRGPRLGQYTLLRQLGEGGTSEVYLARHSLLRRPTAVKLLKTSWETPPGTVQRLEMEAKAISRLTHPNTIELYDFARTSEGIFYYAMEYLPGLNLAELVSLEGPVPEARVVHILKQICGSLREAHQQGLVHRDIKPMNIMLCERGGDYDFVKVLDFGLALQVGESIGHAEPNRIAGTMLYMAPECFSHTCETDVRSDIYSVGAVTYHLLLGRPAFQSVTELDLLNQILQGQPDSIAEHLPRPISPELERLVMDCLDKDPSRRPQSISVLLEVLDSIRNLNPWTQQEARAWWARCAPGLMRAPEVSKR